MLDDFSHDGGNKPHLVELSKTKRALAESERWRAKEGRRLTSFLERIEAMAGEDGVLHSLGEEETMMAGLAEDIENSLAKLNEMSTRLEVRPATSNTHHQM